MTVALSGWGLAHAVVLLSLIAVSGGAAGVIVHRAAARLLIAPGWGSLRLTTAYLGWCLAVAASVVAPLPLLRLAGTGWGLAVLAPLGWPLTWWALIDPTPVVLVGALAVTVGRSSAAPLASARSRPRRRAAVRRCGLWTSNAACRSFECRGGASCGNPESSRRSWWRASSVSS